MIPARHADADASQLDTTELHVAPQVDSGLAGPEREEARRWLRRQMRTESLLDALRRRAN